MVKILQGDCLEVLKTLEGESVHTCVTSPPYWGLRDYGCGGQLGLEPTPEEFIEKMVAVFREVNRVLRKDGTAWVNMGDSYAGGGGYCPDAPSNQAGSKQTTHKGSIKGKIKAMGHMKPKDLCGIPWMLAFALRADGWYLRQDIIWHKPNPMPESVTDRCTKAHEYIFLLSKSKKYYYDADAIREANTEAGRKRLENGTPVKLGGVKNSQRKDNPFSGVEMSSAIGRNKRSVWKVPTAPYKAAHFATFPKDLIRPCILAGCPEGGTVLDPFGGSGTTGEVAEETGRHSIMIELSEEYVKLMRKRNAQPNMFLSQQPV